MKTSELHLTGRTNIFELDVPISNYDKVISVPSGYGFFKRHVIPEKNPTRKRTLVKIKFATGKIIPTNKNKTIKISFYMTETR